MKQRYGAMIAYGPRSLLHESCFLSPTARLQTAVPSYSLVTVRVLASVDQPTNH